MDKNVQVLFLIMIAAMCGNSSPVKYSETDKEMAGRVSIVSREEWKAEAPKHISPMKNPVPYVIIHHSYIPAACYSNADCEAAMRHMQDMHMITNKWDDIGYSFAIGGDNRIYMGRGWDREGAHAPTYNNKSIGICMIGDWRQIVPPRGMLEAAKLLIANGVSARHIKTDYELFGHWQVRNGTECPGEALFNEITTWPHFGKTPPPKYYPPEKKS